MCGRAVVIDKNGIEKIAIEFTIPFSPNMLTAPRYNIKPTQDLPVIRRGDDGQLEIVELRWWLIPSWAKEPTMRFPTFNARADGIAEKPSFRGPFKNRRCLVVVDGFYEWPKKPSKDRNPRLIRFTDRRPMTFAGLWDRWRDPLTGVAIDSCTIVTTEANDLLASVPHDRMPVLLEGEDRRRWLDVGASKDDLRALLASRNADDMDAVIVSAEYVNKGAEDPRCLDPVERAGV